MTKKWLMLIVITVGWCSYCFAQNKSDNNSSVTKPGKVIQMNKALFIQEILDFENNPANGSFKGNKPVIIDFYTDWCIPCRAAGSVMKSLAKEYGEQITIYKVNADKEKELVSLFNIPAYPSFIFINKDGQMKAFTGSTNKKVFKEMIDSFLLEAN